MTNDTGAMTPELDFLVAEDVAEEDDLQVQANLDRERIIASIQLHPGWSALEEKLDSYITVFRTGSFMNGIDKSDLKLVGEKYVIASTIANICEDLKRTVLNAAETVAEHDTRNRTT